MSNNIYDILKTMRGLESPKTTLNEGKKAKPDYLDMDKDGDKKEPMKKAVKDKSKGAIAEAVARVEQQLAEKYMGFKNTVGALKKQGGIENPEALAASIGRKKYGKKKFQDAAAKGKKLGEESESGMTKKVIPVGVIDGPGGYEEAQKRIQDYEAGKINKDGKPLPPVDDRSRPALNITSRHDGVPPPALNITSRHDGVPPPAPAEKPKNEDMLSPKQQKIARMSPPPNKIDANDLAALRAGKKKKAEGNAFSGALDAARDAGQSKFEVDGKTYKVREGWDEMLKAQQERHGPQPSGGSGIKAGKRYGGSAQKDEPETDNETGEVAKKGRGRPKKDKFAK